MAIAFRLLVPAAAFIALASPAEALKFQFRPEPGMDPAAVAAFQAAGKLWENQLADDVTIVIDINFTMLKPTVLGSTSSEKVRVSYKDFREALLRSVPMDGSDQSQQHMAQTETLLLLVNRTSDNPNGAGSDKPYLDDDNGANNGAVWLTRANAKALGLIDPHAPEPDASIAFNTEMAWDFDPANGVEANKFSFIAVAAHEIGHTLGFISGVDILDGNSGAQPDPGPFGDDEFVFVSPADLFRRSQESRAKNPLAIDWSADKRDKTFALRRPTNQDGGFSTGVRHGDGRQASHWKDDMELGLMDPTIAPGTHTEISALDLELFDTVGYERSFRTAAGSGGGQRGPGGMTTRGIVGTVTTSAEAATAQRSGQPTFEYSDAADKPIAELRYSGGMIQNADNTPFVRVYGDGTVRVHRPAYMRNSGEYTLKLTPEQLQDIINNFASETVARTPVLRLDEPPNTVRSVAPTGPSDVIGDHNVRAEVTLQIERIDPAQPGAAAPITNVERRISVPAEGIKSATRGFSPPISGPASGIKQIEGLAADPRLRSTR
jgi:hypothetical protein